MIAVDEFELAERAPAPAPRPARWARRAAPWLAIAVGLILVGALNARPIQEPWQLGILDADLSAAPTQTWRTTLDQQPADMWAVSVVGETLVMGGEVWSGIDVASGAVRWQLEDQASCYVDTVLACVSTGSAADPSAVVTVDAQTGAATIVPGTDGVTSALTVDDDVIVLEPTDEGATVSRLTLDGTALWSSAISTGSSGEHTWASLSRAEDLLAVNSDQSAVLDLTTGEILATPLEAYAYEGTLITRDVPPSAPAPETTLSLGDRTFTSADERALMPVDDMVGAVPKFGSNRTSCQHSMVAVRSSGGLPCPPRGLPSPAWTAFSCWSTSTAAPPPTPTAWTRERCCGRPTGPPSAAAGPAASCSATALTAP